MNNFPVEPTPGFNETYQKGFNKGYAEGYADGFDKAIDECLKRVDAEAWSYCDYLLRVALNGNSDYQRHVSAVSSNIREQLNELKEKGL